MSVSNGVSAVMNKVRSKATALRCQDVSRTKQADKDSADINVIMRKFGVTGVPPVNVRAPTFGDFTGGGIVDFHTAMNVIAQTRESFDSVDAHVRARFHNDPQEFVAFCSDPSNADEMVKLGLLSKVEPVIVAPQKVEIVSPVFKEDSHAESRVRGRSSSSGRSGRGSAQDEGGGT